jgi:putative NIF3 family GTP cyclohydrolase 1 type 2
MKCRVAVTRLGCSAWSDQYAALKSVGADVLICGEAREWEAYEYVRDAAAAGFRKGLIVLGHCASEEPGMEYLAEWLRPRLPGVPVRHVPAGDPFWYA